MAGYLSESERTWIIENYSSLQNVEKVRRKWSETFDKAPPSRQSIYRLRFKFKETGSVKNAPKSGRPRTATAKENEGWIALTLENCPKKSTRKASAELGISPRSVGRLLKRRDLKPFRPRLMHPLSEDDPDRRMQFAEIMLNTIHNNPLFLDRIIWSDEACFRLSGHVTRHNCVYCRDNDPIPPSVNEDEVGVTVWAGLSSSGVLGPYFFDDPMDCAGYLTMLHRDVLPAMQAVPNFNELLFQHDGAPPHYAPAVRNFLDTTFPGRWIGRRGCIDWPPRSPDLNPIDFFFWGAVKEKAFIRKPTSLVELRTYISDACNDITSNLELCTNVCRSVTGKLQACMKAEGGLFEQSKMRAEAKEEREAHGVQFEYKLS